MTDPSCQLCGLPLRFGRIHHTVDRQVMHFCCQGCRMVYIMLLESTETKDPAAFKHTDLYRQCVAAGVIPADEADLRRLREKENGRQHGDAPCASELDPSTTLALNLTIDGMWCTACAWVIERAISRLEGVQTVSCNFSTDRLHCRYRPDRVAPRQIRESVNRLGYVARLAEAGAMAAAAHRKAFIRLVITGLLSANVMMLSWALYAGFFTHLDQDAVSKISWPIVIMATAVMIYGGGPMLRKAWFGLLHGAPGMETLVGAGAGCAFLYSLYNWATGSIHLYFDTACMLITLVLLGKFLEQRAKHRVRRDLNSFFNLQPTKVRRISDHAPAGQYVAIEQLATGDRFAVEADEIVPADGRVVSGTASVDESSLTGEPKPVTVKSGDAVKSGTRLTRGRVVAQAEKVAGDTILGQMIAIMTRSLAQKSAVETRTDRMLRWFVPAIVGAALATGLAGALSGMALHQAVVRAVTVMVISCPCALGVAIPMARLAGVSLAGRHGVLVREIEAFEKAGEIDCVVFDKTGTLTQGRWQLRRVECGSGQDPDRVIAWAFGLEQGSTHEIARSISDYATARGIQPAAVQDVSARADGVEGRLNGHLIRIGNRRFAGGSAQDADPSMANVHTPLSSRVFLSVDGRVAATFLFGDTIRGSTPELVDALQRGSYTLHLISGDSQTAAHNVAAAIGLEQSAGNLLPAAKAAYVDRLTRQGHRVSMVGDGINDAAAMARAHLAVAVYSGSGLAKEAAHITLMRGSPLQLLNFFHLARQVNRKVVQNLWCAWIYNLISIPVAMAGLLTPLVAATAMLLSSLTVIGNTLTLLRPADAAAKTPNLRESKP